MSVQPTRVEVILGVLVGISAGFERTLRQSSLCALRRRREGSPSLPMCGAHTCGASLLFDSTSPSFAFAVLSADSS